MGRTKKVEEVDSDEEIEEVEEKTPKKPARKAPAKKTAAAKKPAAKKKKASAEEDAEVDENEISEDLSADEDDTFPDADPSDKTEVSRKTVIKKTDPNAKLKDLTPIEIIQYLIDKGISDNNPSLKRGGISYKNLILDKRGRHRGSRRNNRYGNNRGFHNPNYAGFAPPPMAYGNHPRPYEDGTATNAYRPSYSRGRQDNSRPDGRPSSAPRNNFSKGGSRPVSNKNSRQPFQAVQQDKVDDLYETDE